MIDKVPKVKRQHLAAQLKRYASGETRVAPKSYEVRG